MPLNVFKLAVLVSGRGSNLQAIIDSIDQKELHAHISIVISNKIDAMALERAKKHDIKTIFIDPASYLDKNAYDKALVEKLKFFSVDLICLAGYMRILGEEVIQTFKEKIINIHPSLLPAFPGLNAQKQAIEYGVKFSGCTVHFVDSGVDSGPIISQTVVPIYDDDDEKSLSERILNEEHNLYPKAIRMIKEKQLKINNRTVTRKTL
ncbi:MAG: phosphoribosylglycinamide formyltransferase [Nitrospina sp.]|nr:phosphoribosylglycinamide formyltransferase [Nitrospina sp.]MBT6600214.1 phosphoribosylglycinamide formyltransferase [Nitrospina sp.]